jgi:UDP-4-amino-4,6-dideoxy-N-acetyl-beta-L-altrosamine N-acetyltransferase
MSVMLRPMAREDGPRVLAWRNGQAVAPYMYSDHQITGEEHARWLEAALGAGDRRYWIIELDGAPVGLANLAGIDADRGRCEWAFYLAEPETRGRGVGAQVEYLVLRHVFEALGLNKLWCEVLAENAEVWRMHESFGFRREAEFRDHVRKGGVFRDVVGLGLLSAEWPEVKARAEARLAEKGVGAEALDAALRRMAGPKA